MNYESAPELLVLHSVRITGFGPTPVIAQRFGLDESETEQALLDAQARGWVELQGFLDTCGWSLTVAGRSENERQLAAELDSIEGRGEIHAGYQDFLPFNARLLRACTDWQLRPNSNDRLAPNDHLDEAWDASILNELSSISASLAPIAAKLEGTLSRFRGYHTRFEQALKLACSGENAWVDRSDIDSCHRVWFELHEDLIASLGLDRKTE